MEWVVNDDTERHLSVQYISSNSLLIYLIFVRRVDISYLLPLQSQMTVDIFKGKRKRNVIDIDGPKFRTERYDPSYGWSIWANERKLEVTTTH